MALRRLPLALLAVATPLLVGADWPDSGVQYAQLTIHERLIVRIPRVDAPRGAAMSRIAPPPIRWDEKSGPKCVAMQTLTGAQIGREGEVDLILGGTSRIRAKLDDNCPTLDFYSGFYLKQTRDGMICAKRDVIRSRSGARCEINRFRALVAKK